jgi:NAD(P)-dependent dehydrogenase (short-subunit alcohol dehydrogenase family)
MNSMKNKIILITGSTDGIGKQTALELAEMGASVIVHGRDPERTRNAAAEIMESAGNPSIDFIVADFSSLQEVKKLSDQLHEKCDQLDVLINNAGVYIRQKEYSKDGFEMTFAVNHLAHFLLTHLVMDLIKNAKGSRIINVASMAHAHEMDFDNLQAEKFFDGYTAYSLSKLCNILFTNELAHRLDGTGVTVNCLHPGVIKTKLLRVGWGMGGSSLESGSKTSVYLASSSDVEKVTGEFFANSRPATSTQISHDIDVQQKLWQMSERLVNPFFIR